MQPSEPEPEPTISGYGSMADHVRRKHANAGSIPAAQTIVLKSRQPGYSLMSIVNRSQGVAGDMLVCQTGVPGSNPGGCSFFK
jgi:hypothetical protein